MFGQAFCFMARQRGRCPRPFTVCEEGFRETPEEFATTYSISGTLLRCYELLNDFYARGGRADGGGRPEQRDVQTGDY